MISLDRKTAVLLGLGLGSLLLYALGISARYPLELGLAQPRVAWSDLAGRPAGLLLHAAVYALLIACYTLALLTTRPQQPALAIGITISGWLLCSAALLRAYPGESADIFDYLVRGRMMAELGASPLARVPAEFRQLPFAEYIGWPAHVDTYGPLWEYASATATAASDGTLIGAITSYRLLAMAMTGGCGLLIYRLVRDHAPEAAPAALVGWLWNPLVLIASAVGAHNDLLMLLLLLLGLRLLQQRHAMLGLLALLLAVHVKLTALLFVPPVLVWLARRLGGARMLREAACALAIGVPLSWLLYAPLGGWSTLGRMVRERVSFVQNAPAELAFWALRGHGWAEGAATHTVALGATLLFSAIAALLLWRLWRAPGLDSSLWGATSSLLCAYLLVGSFWFQPWYLLWLIAPAVLRPESRLARWLLPAFSLGVLWSHAGNGLRPALSLAEAASATVAIQLAPLICVGGALLLWRLRGRWRRLA